MTQASKNQIVSKKIFGSYIQRMKIVPGMEKKGHTKEEEKKLFEMVDEYVEEA